MAGWAAVAAFAAVLLGTIVASAAARRSWRVPFVLGLVDLLFIPAGFALTLVDLVGAFQAVAAVNPADRATILSAGISEAMNCLAAGAIVGIPGFALGGALLYVAFSRRGRLDAPTSSRPRAPAPASAAGS